MSTKEWFGARRWFLDEDTLAGLLFVGAPVLLRLLDDLVRRPRRYGREKLLPIVYLVQQAPARSPLDGIAERHKRPRVVHARVPGRPGGSVRDLLEAAVAGLSGKFRGVRPIKFPHFSVAIWLRDLHARKLSPEQSDQVYKSMVDELKRFIERRHRRVTHADAELSDLADDLPWWIRLPSRRLPRFGLFLLRRSWSVPRWFAAHPLGERLGHGNFYRLARTFAVDHGKLSAELLDGLLVDAFLHDLRRAYRRTTVFGSGRRRSTYPVLLLDDAVAGSSALRLLELINQSRNGPPWRSRQPAGRRPRYRWDPLLVIATGDVPDQQALVGSQAGTDAVAATPADATYAYEAWIREVEQAGRRDRSWILPLDLSEAEKPRSGARDELLKLGLPRAFPLMVTHLLLVLLPVVAIGTVQFEHDRCWTYPWEPGLQRVSQPTGPDQCVGLSSGRHRFFADLSDVDGLDPGLAQQLAAVEDGIHRTNALATRRPGYRTLVFLSNLTPDSLLDYRIALEELRGIAIAQDDEKDDVPLRLLLANAGPRMEHGEFAAGAIAREAAHDPTLVGVVGLGISTESTRRTMLRLHRAGLPMVGTVISHVGLATTTTDYYHQVGPTNRREATVLAHYIATKLRVERATIYYSSDPNDIYSDDLAQQLHAALGDKGIFAARERYRANAGDDGAEPRVLGQAACQLGTRSAAVFAGRAEAFRPFLAGLQNGCPGRYPHVVAGDDVTGLVLDNGLGPYANITVDYVSFASSLAWGSGCGESLKDVSFYTQYRKLFGEACSSTRDGHAMLARDAASTLAQAIRRNHEAEIAEPSPALVLREIDEISDQAGAAGIWGATGRIDYRRSDAQHEQGVPDKKAIMLLSAKGNGQPRRIWLCGRLDTAEPPPDAACPP